MTGFIGRVEAELNIPRGTLAPETPLAGIPQLDSLGRVTLLVMLDTEYGTYVEPQQIDGCETVADLYGLVDRQSAAA
jgi:acyl carrier protein